MKLVTLNPSLLLLHSRENILKTAKALVEDTKLLVSGAGASQEKLAQAAQSSVTTITKLADVVKLGAASLGSEDPETQVGHCHRHSMSPSLSYVWNIHLFNTLCTIVNNYGI